MSTLEDLEKAQKEVQRWEDAWENYSGNNPNKFSSQLKNARRELDYIIQSLKKSGILPKTEEEKLSDKLDKLYPNAMSKRIVELDGVQYQKKYYPLEKSRSGKTVTRWGAKWIKLASK